MDGVSIFNELAWQPEFFAAQPDYQAANALGWLYRTNKQASVNHSLAGRLYLAKSNWLLLSVPNSLVRGLFDALTAPGIELPTAGVLNVPNVKADVLNAHISVMNADEVAAIGADKISERGHMFGYTLGALTEMEPRNIDGVSKLWLLQVASPALSALRKSYGLSPLLNGHAFHITIAVRRKHVLRNNDVRKTAGATSITYDCGCSGACMCPDTCVCKQSGYCCSAKRAAEIKDVLPGGAADHAPDTKFDSADLAEGIKHEHEHTDNDQIAKEIAKDHLSEDSNYYAEQEKTQRVNSRPRIIDELLAAKAHSDAGRYAHKNDIVRRLMVTAPEEWQIDQPHLPYKGVRHIPTKFKLHVDPTVIPPTVKAAQSVYFDQFNLRNMLAAQNPISYDAQKPFMANVKNYLERVKARGDFRLMAARNNENYKATFDPNYRYQRAVDAFRNTLPMPSLTDQLIERHGNSLLDKLGMAK